MFKSKKVAPAAAPPTQLPQDIKSLIAKLAPRLQHVHKVLLARDKSNTPSTLANKDALEDLAARASDAAFNPSLDELISVISSTSSRKPFSQSDNYPERIRIFCNYIAGRWVALGENNKTKTRLTKSIAEFFLHCHNLEPDVLKAQFPMQKQDFNCFDGLCERLDAVRSQKDFILQTLEEASFAILAQAHEVSKKTVSTGGDVHAAEFVKRVVKDASYSEAEPIAAAFEVSSLNLFSALNSYTQNLPAEVDKRLTEQFDITGKIIELSSKIIADFKREKSLTLADGSKILFTPDLERRLTQCLSGKGLEITESELQNFFGVKNLLEEKLVEALKRTFPFLQDKVIEGIILFDEKEEDPLQESETDDESGILKINFAAINKIFNEARTRLIALELESHVKEFTAVRSVVDSMPPREHAPLDAEKIYTNNANYAQRLASKNPLEMLEALNAIYAMAKRGHGSCALHVFKFDIQASAQKLDAQFQQELARENPDPFYQENYFKLASYLKRAQRAHNYFAQQPIQASLDLILRGKIAEVDFSKIDNASLLFIFNNLSKADMGSFAIAITPQQAFILITSETQEFGKTISSFTRQHLLQSLLLRPQFIERVLPKLVHKAFRNFPEKQQQKTLLLVNFLVLARALQIEDVSAIAKELNKIDPNSINLAGNEDLVFSYLRAKNRQPITQGDALLRFITRFNLEAIDENGATLFQAAVENGHLDVVKNLVAITRDLGPARVISLIGSSLLTSIKRDQVAVTEYLIETIKTCGSSPREVLSALNPKDTHQNSALLVAQISLNPAYDSIVTKLIEAIKTCGAPGTEIFAALSEKNNTNSTFLMNAATKGSSDRITSLISTFKACGASNHQIVAAINEKNNSQQSAILYAARNGRLDFIKTLLQEMRACGASSAEILEVINLQGANNNTALMLAAANNHSAVVKFLIEEIANCTESAAEVLSAINLQNNVNSTALSIAMTGSDVVLAQHLINVITASGSPQQILAALNIKDVNGNTALFHALTYAAQNDRSDLVLALTDSIKTCGASKQEVLAALTCKNEAGDTPLMVAAKMGHAPTFKILIEAIQTHATSTNQTFHILNEEDKNGNTPLMMVKNAEVARELMGAMKSYGGASGPEVLDAMSKKNHAFETAFSLALTTHRTDVIKSFISEAKESGASKPEVLMLVSEKDVWGFTPLQLAVKSGNAVAIEVVTDEMRNCGKSDAEVLAIMNEIPESGITNLMLASANNFIFTAKTLIARNFQLSGSRKQTLAFITQQQATTGDTALTYAAKYKRVDSVKSLIQEITNYAKSPQKILSKIFQCNNAGETPLMLAAQNGRSDIVAIFLDALESCKASSKETFAAINSVNKAGETALMLAFKNRQTSTAKLIIDAIKSTNSSKTLEAINHQNINGDTALTLAAALGHGGICYGIIGEIQSINPSKVLPALNHKNKEGNTALIAATNSNHPHVVKALLDGIKVCNLSSKDAYEVINQKDNQGRRALMLAANNGHVEIVKELIGGLLACNASGSEILSTITKKDADGNNAFMLAAKAGCKEIVRDLIEGMKTCGALPTEILSALNEKNKAGNTAFTLTTSQEISEQILVATAQVSAEIPSQASASSRGFANLKSGGATVSATARK